MEREANYAAVGAFVLLIIGMAALFVYWYTDAREHHDFTR
jgi:ABC-type transporter Mla subunit MlaD